MPKLAKTVIIMGILCFLTAIFVYPIVWTLSASLKSTSEIFSGSVGFIPEHIAIDNYFRLFSEQPFALYFLNSAIVSLGCVVITIFVSSMGGLAFAKYVFPFRNALFMMAVISLMIPFQILIVSLYFLMLRFKLVNTHIGAILPLSCMSSAFGVFYMRQYLVGLPSALMDAARVDGATEFGIYWRVVMPICKPALTVLTVYSFMVSWNAFLWPLVVMQEQRLFPVNVGITTLVGAMKTEWGMVMAAGFLAILPMLIMFLCLGKQFVTAIIQGSIKG